MTSRRISPTVRRRRLGAELRRIREEQRRPADEVVKYMAWSLSKLSRIESGKISVAWESVTALLAYYGVDGERHDALVRLAREAKQEGWWQPYSDFLSKDYATYIGLETAAETLRVFHAQGVPGLLQTADYARTVIAEAGSLTLTRAEIDHRLDLRLKRQKVLHGEDPLEMWVILDEASLRRVIGGAETMRFQLLHLVETAQRPNINIQVIPFDVGPHSSMNGTYGIFGFPEGEADVPFIETFAGTLYLETAGEIRAANLNFSHLQATALSARETLRHLETLAKHYA